MLALLDLLRLRALLSHARNCYKVIQDFMVTGLFAGQHNTKLHGTITGVLRPDKYNTIIHLTEQLFLLQLFFERWRVVTITDAKLFH